MTEYSDQPGKRRGKIILNYRKDRAEHIFLMVEMYMHAKQHSKLHTLCFETRFFRKLKVDT
jgi:hypothetical protein